MQRIQRTTSFKTHLLSVALPMPKPLSNGTKTTKITWFIQTQLLQWAEASSNEKKRSLSSRNERQKGPNEWTKTPKEKEGIRLSRLT